MRKYLSCVHELPIFVSFDKTQIVWINSITEWLNFNLEPFFIKHFSFFCATNIYSFSSVYF